MANNSKFAVAVAFAVVFLFFLFLFPFDFANFSYFDTKDVWNYEILSLSQIHLLLRGYKSARWIVKKRSKDARKGQDKPPDLSASAMRPLEIGATGNPVDFPTSTPRFPTYPPVQPMHQSLRSGFRSLSVVGNFQAPIVFA